jgi:Zn-dependent protease
MSRFLASTLYTLIYSLPATLIAIVLHEVAHALVSYWCGDKLVKADGRLSLNPLKHLDPVGTLCLVVFHFGWAKPVMVDTRNYKHKKLDFCLVALAGPVMNFLIAFVSMIFMFITAMYLPGGIVTDYLYNLFYFIALIDVGLGVFNLIPIPPLDGSNVILSLLPERISMAIRPYRQYFSIILLVLIFFGSFSNILQFLNSNIVNGMWGTVLKLFGYGISKSGMI